MWSYDTRCRWQEASRETSPLRILWTSWFLAFLSNGVSPASASTCHDADHILNRSGNILNQFNFFSEDISQVSRTCADSAFQMVRSTYPISRQHVLLTYTTCNNCIAYLFSMADTMGEFCPKTATSYKLTYISRHSPCHLPAMWHRRPTEHSTGSGICKTPCSFS